MNDVVDYELLDATQGLSFTASILTAFLFARTRSCSIVAIKSTAQRLPGKVKRILTNSEGNRMGPNLICPSAQLDMGPRSRIVYYKDI